MKLLIFTDGGSRGNPGPAAVGIVILDEKQKEIFSKACYIGWATNNQAEYRAVLEALLWLKNNCQGVEKAEFWLDSQLVVAQLNGRFKIKSLNLKPLIFQINKIRQQLPFPITFQGVKREKNIKADNLVNQVLDKLNFRR